MIEFKFTTENYELLRFLHKEVIRSLDEIGDLEYELISRKRELLKLYKKLNEITNKLKLNEDEKSGSQN